MSTTWAFDSIENKPTLYRGEDSMKKFCESLGEHAKNIIDFQKKKMLPLTKQKIKAYQDGKIFYIFGKRILKRFANDKSYRKVRDYCHFTSKYSDEAHSTCNLKFNVPNDISVVFHKTVQIMIIFLS